MAVQYIKKIENKYVNIAIAMLTKKIDSSWFGYIQIKELKTQPFSWVVIETDDVLNNDDEEDIAFCNLPLQIRKALKDF